MYIEVYFSRDVDLPQWGYAKLLKCDDSKQEKDHFEPEYLERSVELLEPHQ